MTYEDIVTFEQAKALKDLGFVWECMKGYAHYPNENVKTFNAQEENINGKYNEWCYSAPTLYQAKKWLIDKFSLGVSSLPFVGDPNNDVLRWRYYVDKYNPYIIQEESIKLYDTYEKALSEGIDRALKILKEKKDEINN